MKRKVRDCTGNYYLDLKTLSLYILLNTESIILKSKLMTFNCTQHAHLINYRLWIDEAIVRDSRAAKFSSQLSFIFQNGGWCNLIDIPK